MPKAIFRNASGGVVDLDPSRLPEAAVQRAVNVTFRGLAPKTRPGFVARETLSEDPETPRGFKKGYLQGAFDYRPDSGNPTMVLVIDGSIYLWEPSTDVLLRQDASAGPMSPQAERVWAQQRGGELIIQDGVHRPRIVVPGSTRVSKRSTKEIPVGTCMANGHGRVTMATVNRRTFIAGDHELAQGVVPDVGLHTFTDTDYLFNAGAMQPPSEHGEIIAQKYVQQYDTSTGVGALVVFSDRGLTAFATNVPRTQWSSQDISQVLMSGDNVGAVSPDAVVPYGEDLFYVSPEGLKSIRTARATNLPFQVVNLSADVLPIWQDQDRYTRKFCSAVAHDSRILYTVGASQERPDGRPPRPYFKGILAYNLDPVNGRLGRPVQDGLWTGLKIQRLVSVGHKSFIIAWDNGENRIYEIDPEARHDVDPSGEDRAIGCQLWFGTSAFEGLGEWKDIGKVSLGLRKLVGKVKARVKLRFDQSPRLVTSFTFEHEAGYKVRPVGTVDEIPTLQPHHLIRREGAGGSESDRLCDPTTGQLLTQFREAQPVIEWDGSATFEQVEVEAKVIRRQDQPACLPSEASSGSQGKTPVGFVEDNETLFGYDLRTAGSAEVKEYVQQSIN